MKIIDKREKVELCNVENLKVGDTFIRVHEEYNPRTHTATWVENTDKVFIVIDIEGSTTHCLCVSDTGVCRSGFRMGGKVKPVDIDISIVK